MTQTRMRMLIGFYCVLLAGFVCITARAETFAQIPLAPGSSISIQTLTGTTSVSCALSSVPNVPRCNIVRRNNEFSGERFDVYSNLATSQGPVTNLISGGQYTYLSFEQAVEVARKAQAEGLCIGGMNFPCTIQHNTPENSAETYSLIAIDDSPKGVKHFTKYSRYSREPVVKALKALQELGICQDPRQPQAYYSVAPQPPAPTNGGQVPAN